MRSQIAACGFAIPDAVASRFQTLSRGQTASGRRVIYGSLAWIIMGLGAVLRLASFFTNRSPWEDEGFLALNIRGRSFAGLLSPLDLNQVAPIGFLVSEKLATRLFGPADWVLRLIPLGASLVTLPLFHAVALRILQVPAALIALLLFSVSVYVVYYTAEVKPYGTDVTVTLGLIWCALSWMECQASQAPLAGRHRAWLVLSHVYIGAGRVNQADVYLKMLDRMGTRQDHFAAEGADLYLFDFSAMRK